jgi:hypothetical protein
MHWTVSFVENCFQLIMLFSLLSVFPGVFFLSHLVKILLSLQALIKMFAPFKTLYNISRSSTLPSKCLANSTFIVGLFFPLVGVTCLHVYNGKTTLRIYNSSQVTEEIAITLCWVDKCSPKVFSEMILCIGLAKCTPYTQSLSPYIQYCLMIHS